MEELLERCREVIWFNALEPVDEVEKKSNDYIMSLIEEIEGSLLSRCREVFKNLLHKFKYDESYEGGRTQEVIEKLLDDLYEERWGI